MAKKASGAATAAARPRREARSGTESAKSGETRASPAKEKAAVKPSARSGGKKAKAK